MTLALEKQYHLAVNDTPFRGRVTASLTATAIVKFTATALSDPDEQKQRLALCSEVLDNPGGRVTQFAWIVVVDASLTDPEIITDAQVNTRIAATFDTAARLLVVLPP